MFRSAASILCLTALAGCSLVPESSRRASQQAVRPAQPVYAASGEARQCLSRLGATQASFSPIPDKYYGAGCSTLNSVQLSALHGDKANMMLSNLGPVACPLATSFASWARYGVDRAARKMLGSPLVRIETFGSYNCRNVAGSSRLSAHATANAIDVSAFVLADGRHISVKGDWNGGTSAERNFLRVVHQSACKRFGTVLGPDYNEAHRDHLHLEGSGSAFCR